MAHDPVEQGHHKYNSFLSSVFILRADAKWYRILILLLYYLFYYCKLFAVQLKW